MTSPRKTFRCDLLNAAFLCVILAVLFTPARALAAFGLTTATDSYTVDTGAGLVFKVRRTDNGSNTQSPGDIMSLVYNGVEYQDLSRGTQVNSGFDYLYTGVSAVTVSGETVGTDYIKITVVAGNLTHYYMVRKGLPHVYMATYFTTEPDTLGLCRYIVRIPATVLTNGPAPSDIRNNTGAIESGDIFGMSDGTSRSKHYSNMRLKDWSHIGADNSTSSPTAAVWMVRDNNEGGSGGPFYRCLLNQCGTDQEITYIVNYGEAQTEALRTSILNSYTLMFTNGGTPPAVDTSWFSDMGLIGYVAPGGRGSVTCSQITGRDTSYAYTVGFSNATAQYWTDANQTNGSFTMSGMIPGTYTLKVYKNELAVYTDTNVTVTAGGTTTLNPIAITGDPSRTVTLWRIGNWDGTPNEFLYADKVTTMHPSDVRITGTSGTAAWSPGTYVIGTSTPSTGMPCYQWKTGVNGSQSVQFNLTASQLVSSTVRIGITCAFAGGRPNISVNSWSNTNLPSASTQPDTRTLTVGTYRGNNTTYTFAVPSSALVVGTNTLTFSVISGSSGTTYLSPGYSLDCVEFSQGSQTLALPSAPTGLSAIAGNGQVTLNWSPVAGAASYDVLRGLAGGGPYSAVAGSVSGPSYTDTGLTNGTTYFYVVAARNSSGAGLYSNEASVIPDANAPPTPPAGLAATAYNKSVYLTWNASTDATSYNIKRSTTSGSGYVTIQSVSSPTFSDTGLTNGTIYYYVVSAANSKGEGVNSNEANATPNIITWTFTSNSSQDGWVYGLSGNTAGSSINTTSRIVVGDHAANRQYKGILSFDTSTIPDSATISSATLKMRRFGVTNTNPFTIFGSLFADIKAGSGFNNNVALEAGDFQATADATQVATFASSPATNGDWATAILNGTGTALIDKAGTTQLRIYFTTPTNNNSLEDSIQFNSGNDSNSSYRPVLEVTSSALAPGSGPTACLRLDETGGPTAADSSGNGWNGSLVNGPAWVAGRINNAVSLDGANDHLTLPSGVVSEINDFTISAWVKLNAITSGARLFDFGAGTSVSMYLTPRSGATNAVRFAITTGGAAGEQSLDGAAPLDANAWVHVAVTLSGSTGTLYVNGAAVGTNASMSLRPSSLGNTPINYLGRSQSASDPYLNGLIDEFRIYDRALSSEEIAQLLAPPAAPTTPTATANDSQAVLSWGAVSGATGYNVKRSTTSGGPYVTVATGLTNTSFVNTGLTNGTTYYYVVSALKGVSESANSSQVSATPLSPTAAPTGLTATPGNRQVFLNWNTLQGAVTYYIKAGLSSGGPYVLLNSVDGSATTYIDTNLMNGTTYYYVVSAAGSNGLQGPDSNEASATPAAPAAAPQLTTAVSRKTQGGAGSFDIPIATSAGATAPSECRSGNTLTLVATFDKAVTAGTATIAAGTATVGTPAFSGSTMTIPLTAVANAQSLQVNLSSVTAADGGVLANAVLKVGVLAGDANGDSFVNTTDMVAVRSRSGQGVDNTNCRYDLNTDGLINTTDMISARNNSGTALP